MQVIFVNHQVLWSQSREAVCNSHLRAHLSWEYGAHNVLVLWYVGVSVGYNGQMQPTSMSMQHRICMTQSGGFMLFLLEIHIGHSGGGCRGRDGLASAAT